MEWRSMVAFLSALFAVGFAFAVNDEQQDTDAFALKDRFARDLEAKKTRFAFAFAKRSSASDDAERQQRFARDLEGKKKFAFAFAKRSDPTDEEENLMNLRFARSRDFDNIKNSFAKRSNDDLSMEERFARFARAIKFA